MSNNMDYQLGVQTIKGVQSHETPDLHPLSYTRLMEHGRKTKTAILFFHGYTSSPQQFTPLGEKLFNLGYNVFIPRLPHHGLKDTLTDETRYLNRIELEKTAKDSLDLVSGLGENIIVCGLSMGGVLTAFLSQMDPRVSKGVIISPAFGTPILPPSLLAPAAWILGVLPENIRWWDDEKKDNVDGPEYAYKRFSTHGLMEIFKLGLGVSRDAIHHKPAGNEIWMVLNENDHSVDNRISEKLCSSWTSTTPNSLHRYLFPSSLMLPHDIISMEQSKNKPDLVYPVLMSILTGMQIPSLITEE